MPGPLLAFTISSAAQRSPYVGFLVILGHGIFESTLVVLIFLGAATFLGDPTLLRILGGLGAAVLVYMGVMMLRDVPKISLKDTVRKAIGADGSGSEEAGAIKPAGSALRNPILVGLLFTVLNPTFPIWWAGVGFGLVAKYGTNATNVAVFYAGHISADLLWYVTIGLVVGYGKAFISDRAYRIFMAVCATFLIFLGLSFAHGAAKGHGPAKASVEAPASTSAR